MGAKGDRRGQAQRRQAQAPPTGERYGKSSPVVAAECRPLCRPDGACRHRWLSNRGLRLPLRGCANPRLVSFAAAPLASPARRCEGESLCLPPRIGDMAKRQKRFSKPISTLFQSANGRKSHFNGPCALLHATAYIYPHRTLMLAEGRFRGISIACGHNAFSACTFYHNCR